MKKPSRFDEIPLGFGMALAQNLEAMNHFSTLSEDKKQKVVDRASHAASKQEMHSIVNQLADNTFTF